MNFKMVGLVFGAIAGAISVGGALRKVRKTPLICSPMMEELSRKIYDDYKKVHNGKEPSREEFDKLWAEEMEKLKK